MTELHKTCGFCRLSKPVSEFHKGKGKFGKHGYCKTCNKAKTKLWKVEHPEQHKEYHTQYYNNHKEEQLVSKAVDYIINAESKKSKRREYVKNNPDKIKQQRHRRRAIKFNAYGSYTIEEIEELFEKQQCQCNNPYCRRNLDATTRTLDHVIPLTKGGSNDISNLQ